MAPPNYSKGRAGLLSPVRVLGPVLLSLAVLVVIAIVTFDPDQFERMITELNGWWLAAALGTVAARVFAGGWRIAYVSRGHLRFSDGVRAQLAWDFFSNVTPSAIGGGPIAALYVARDRGISLGQATALMLFTILLDQVLFAFLVPLLLVGALFINVFPDSLGVVGESAFITLFVGIFGWVIVFSYAMLVRPDLLESLAGRIFRLRFLRRYRDRAETEARQLRQRAIFLRRQPPSFFVNGLMMTVLLWLTRFALPVFIVLAVFDDLDALLAFTRTVAMSVGAVILPTPGGSGGIEGLYALLLGPLMPETLVAPTLLTWRIFGYYLFIALGIYLSMHQVHKSIRRRRSHRRGTDGLTGHEIPAEPEYAEEWPS